MYPFKLIVGESLNDDFIGMNKIDDTFGTVVPNYIGGQLISALMIGPAGVMGMATGGKIDGDKESFTITFATSLSETFNWDDVSKTYSASTPNVTIYPMLLKRMDEVVEFTISNLSTTPVTKKAPPPPADEPEEKPKKKKKAKKAEK